MLYNFFEKRSVFWGNYKKLFWGEFDHFLGKAGFLGKKLIQLFYHELGNECFITKQVFQKKQYFWGQWEKILGGRDHFLGEGVILRQKWI